jgi:uncharacterized protein YukE
MKQVSGKWLGLMERWPEAFESAVETWHRTFQQLERFLELNGRLPTQTAKDEKRLGIWVGTQKTNYDPDPGRCKDGMKQVSGEWLGLMERWPEAFESAEETWRRTFQQVERFLEVNGRLPLKTAKDEKRLGQWVSNQKTNYDPDPDRCKYVMKQVSGQWTGLMERWPEAFESAVETWRRTFQQVERFLELNGRLPTQRDEKRLGQWVCTQKTNYDPDPDRCKKRMKQVSGDWTGLMERWPEAFQNSSR